MTNEADYLKRQTASQQMDPAVNRPFNAADFARLSRNSYHRWYPNSGEIGLALLRTDPDGTEVAEQYDIPQDDISEDSKEDSKEAVPRIRHLMHIKAYQHQPDPNGPAVLYYRAVVQEGDNVKRMIGTRATRIEIVDKETGAVEQARIVYFDAVKRKPFLGSTEEIPLFKGILSAEQLKLKEKCETIGSKIKGGRTLLIDPACVAVRIKTTRARSQKAVMHGRSAVKEYARFLKPEIREILHPEMMAKFVEAIEADLNHPLESHKRPEWCHVYAFALTLLSENPQSCDNLIAAPRWLNTTMLVLECTAVWFALKRPHALVHMRAIFETLMNSHILKKGEYEISIEEQSRCIRLFENYDLSLKQAIFSRPSDLAQTSAISCSLLGHKLPISRYAVEGQTIAGPLPIINSMTIVSRERLEAEQRRRAAISSIPREPFTPLYSAQKNASKRIAEEKTAAEAGGAEETFGLGVRKGLSFYWGAILEKSSAIICPNPQRVVDFLRKIRP